MVTYVFETDYEIDRSGYFWGIIKKNWSLVIADSIKGLRMLANRKGCVFDIDDKFEQEIESVGQKISNSRLKIYQPKELPELEEKPNTGPMNSYSNGRDGL